MKVNIKHLGHKLRHETSGQVFAWAVVAMIALLGMCGFVVDLGHAMLVNRQLQMTTNAAALAGAEDLPNSNYQAFSKTYSSNVSTDDNYASVHLTGVSTSVAGYCSSIVTSWGIDCQTISGTSMNALTVTQTVTIPTYFISVLGIDSVTLTSKASAAWKGAARNPYNVAIIVDTTASMQDADGDASNCGSASRIACTMQGVNTLLEYLSPCSPTYTTCPTVSAAWPSANITQPIDEVALYTFPALVNSAAAENDAICGAQMTGPTFTTTTGSGKSQVTTYTGTISYYNYPGTASTPTPDPVYQMVGFSSDYKNSDAGHASTNLISSSYLVKATGGGTNTSCTWNTSQTGGVRGGLQDVGGASTYYAGVVYQAQSDLYNQYATRLYNNNTQTQNIMIALTDGDAEANSTDLGYINQTTGVTTTNSNTNGSYPSYHSECHQAITAALAATNGTYPSTEVDSEAVPDTIVYGVAYGAEASGCSTDSGLEPCDTIREMSSSYNWSPSSDQTFFSDYTSSGSTSTCISNSHPSTSINSIFQQIALTLSIARLIPIGS
jgi:Flp pilus assembly protein TadG